MQEMSLLVTEPPSCSGQCTSTQSEYMLRFATGAEEAAAAAARLTQFLVCCLIGCVLGTHAAVVSKQTQHIVHNKCSLELPVD